MTIVCVQPILIMTSVFFSPKDRVTYIRSTVGLRARLPRFSGNQIKDGMEANDLPSSDIILSSVGSVPLLDAFVALLVGN